MTIEEHQQAAIQCRYIASTATDERTKATAIKWAEEHERQIQRMLDKAAKKGGQS